MYRMRRTHMPLRFSAPQRTTNNAFAYQHYVAYVRAGMGSSRSTRAIEAFFDFII